MKKDNFCNKSIKDMWNASMLEGARYTLINDIPYCESKVPVHIPKKLICYSDACDIYKKRIRKEPNFHINAYIHFYIYDQFFDGSRKGIFANPKHALDVIRHFDGIITPDVSTFCDFPDSTKRESTKKMRAFGYWVSSHNIAVINNVRWGTEETWEYCFDGIPYNGIVAIGTVASGINRIVNRPLFEDGLLEMVDILNPKIIIVYGSAKNKVLQNLKKRGITIIEFKSKTNEFFEKRR